jgi:miniconductance mechanosensitive channel
VVDGYLRDWLLQRGVNDEWAALSALLIELTVVALLAVIVHFLVRAVVVRGVTALAHRSETTWGQALVRRRPISRLAHLAPALVIYHFAGTTLQGYGAWAPVVQQACLIYMIITTAWMASGFLSVIDDVGRESPATKDLPVRSFVQVARIVLVIVTGIAVLSLVLGQLLLSGLGAMTAVLLLIFKDAILGLVAGVQLSANRMVAIGDWIEMPKYGADGDVIEVALTTVKVRNWDRTITTVPTYALISESFKNWRGMFESGGRRIKRAIYIDMTSIRFCTDEMLERYARIQHVSEYLERKREEITRWNVEHGIDLSVAANGRRLTNVGTFRAYIDAYLRHHPLIHNNMTFLVRHLAPTAEGLPIEIYVFTTDTRWSAHEGIQADVFDHILAVAPEFDLRVFQNPSGADIRAMRAALALPAIQNT